jgi:hypothetical protein
MKVVVLLFLLSAVVAFSCGDNKILVDGECIVDDCLTGSSCPNYCLKYNDDKCIYDYCSQFNEVDCNYSCEWSSDKCRTTFTVTDIITTSNYSTITKSNFRNRTLIFSDGTYTTTNDIFTSMNFFLLFNFY